MATVTRPRSPAPETTGPDTARPAFWVLRATFFLLPVLAGLDKFFGWMTDWHKYLWAEVPEFLPGGAHDIMRVVGVVEIAAGVLVLLVPIIGAPLVAAWLAVVTTNLIIQSATGVAYWDIALRDAGLMLAAVALALLARTYGTVANRRQRAAANRS